METFYVKQGKRYKPVLYGDETFNHAMPSGTHLVVVQPGLESRIYHIQPDAAPLLATAKLAEDKVLAKMREISALRPQATPITLEQKQAWDNLRAVMGDDLFYFTYSSLKEIYDTMVTELVRLSQANE